MDRRRLTAAAFFSTVIVVVLGVMVYLQQAGNQQTISVYILKHAVLAGSPYAADDISAITVRAQEGDFQYEHRSPAQYAARYTQNLHPNDIRNLTEYVSTLPKWPVRRRGRPPLTMRHGRTCGGVDAPHITSGHAAFAAYV